MKVLKHNNYILKLEIKETPYKVQMHRFKKLNDAHGQNSVRFKKEYFIPNWEHSYNCGRELKDFKYMLDNINQYEWLKPFIEK